MGVSSYRLGVLLFFCACFSLAAFAGDLTPPAAPENAGSAFYSLEDLYQRLDNGAAGNKRSGAFTEPGSGPTAGTMHNLNEIMSKMPTKDDTNGVSDTSVLQGKTYWGLTSGQWGPKVGAMPNVGLQNVTPSTSEQAITKGYHNGSGKVAGDADLVAGNIRKGINLFGVDGNANVVNTSSGDATAADIKSGKKAWVDGSEITGTYSKAEVAKTGQTVSFVAKDDGNLQKGVAWPNPRFTDNADGTVTDNLTGLVWLKNISALGLQDWSTAVSLSSSLKAGQHGLTDGSVAGDWRLPNIRELLSLMDFGRHSPALPPGHPFINVPVGMNNYFHSSTSAMNNSANNFSIDSDIGCIIYGAKTFVRYPWPVRDQ